MGFQFFCSTKNQTTRFPKNEDKNEEYYYNRKTSMLIVKPSLYFDRSKDVDNHHPFHKSIHSQNIKSIVDRSLSKEQSNRLSENWSKKSK